MTDSFDVEASVSAVLSDDEKPEGWDEMSLSERLDYIAEVILDG